MAELSRIFDGVSLRHLYKLDGLDGLIPFYQGSGQTVPAIHQATTHVYNDGKFGIDLIDSFAMGSYFSDRRRAAHAKPAISVQFLKTFDLHVKFR